MMGNLWLFSACEQTRSNSCAPTVTPQIRGFSRNFRQKRLADSLAGRPMTPRSPSCLLQIDGRMTFTMYPLREALLGEPRSTRRCYQDSPGFQVAQASSSAVHVVPLFSTCPQCTFGKLPATAVKHTSSPSGTRATPLRTSILKDVWFQAEYTLILTFGSSL